MGLINCERNDLAWDTRGLVGWVWAKRFARSSATSQPVYGIVAVGILHVMHSTLRALMGFAQVSMDVWTVILGVS